MCSVVCVSCVSKRPSSGCLHGCSGSDPHTLCCTSRSSSVPLWRTCRRVSSLRVGVMVCLVKGVFPTRSSHGFCGHPGSISSVSENLSPGEAPNPWPDSHACVWRGCGGWAEGGEHESTHAPWLRSASSAEGLPAPCKTSCLPAPPMIPGGPALSRPRACPASSGPLPSLPADSQTAPASGSPGGSALSGVSHRPSRLWSRLLTQRGHFRVRPPW